MRRLDSAKGIGFSVEVKIARVRTQSKQIVHAALQEDGSYLRIEGNLWGAYSVTEEKVHVAELLAPLEPDCLIAIGLNYAKHAAESGSRIPDYPMVFMKFPSSLQDPGKPIVIPTSMASTKVDYEIELAIVIGKDCFNVSEEDALDYVFGYTIANDVSARDWQSKEYGGGQFCRAKSFLTFCPLGPCITTADEIPDPGNLRLVTKVDGETRQNSSTADLIFPVSKIISFLSGSTLLRPGTVILTGTPEGVGMGRKPPEYLLAGQQVEMEIEQIGVLSNPVVSET